MLKFNKQTIYSLNLVTSSHPWIAIISTWTHILTNGYSRWDSTCRCQVMTSKCIRCPHPFRTNVPNYSVQFLCYFLVSVALNCPYLGTATIFMTFPSVDWQMICIASLLGIFFSKTHWPSSFSVQIGNIDKNWWFLGSSSYRMQMNIYKLSLAGKWGEGGGTWMSRGVSGLSKNSRSKGLFFTIKHCTCIMWIGYQIHVKLV